MKRKLLTTIILGITITSMFISCGNSTKDKDKKERKKVETSSISAEKSTKAPPRRAQCGTSQTL